MTDKPLVHRPEYINGKSVQFLGMPTLMSKETFGNSTVLRTHPLNDKTKELGSLSFSSKTGRIHSVSTKKEHQGKGIATGLYVQANRTVLPEGTSLSHSSNRTDQGDAWAKSVGGDIPMRKPEGYEDCPGCQSDTAELHSCEIGQE
jgi:hypothetical protein